MFFFLSPRLQAYIAAGLLALAGICSAVLLAGCITTAAQSEPTVQPDGFGGLNDKATGWAQKVSAGVAVTGERIAAKDLPGAKVANDLTAALLPAPGPVDLDWFRKLCDPAATITEIAKAKTENAALLAEVQTLRTKVANGISPEESARRVKQAKDDEAARNAKLWRNRILYGLCGLTAATAIGFIAAGAYFGVRRLILVGVVLIPCAAFIGKIPDFLESIAFQRVQSAVTYSLGAAILVAIGYGLYEVIKWLRRAKPAVIAATLAAGVKSAM